MKLGDLPKLAQLVNGDLGLKPSSFTPEQESFTIVLLSLSYANLFMSYKKSYKK